MLMDGLCVAAKKSECKVITHLVLQPITKNDIF